MKETATASCSLLSQIASLTREELTERLLHFHGKFPLDFTETYLARKSTEELRHLLVAACKHAAVDA